MIGIAAAIGTVIVNITETVTAIRMLQGRIIAALIIPLRTFTSTCALFRRAPPDP